MNSQTTEKLYQMKMGAMAEAFCKQIADPSSLSLSFEERFALCVEKEWLTRENKKMGRRMKSAKLKQGASMEDIDYRHPRDLDKSVIRSLMNCQWIQGHQNIIITGPTGVGKSYLAEAFAQKACREGYSAWFVRMPRLLRELEGAHADGSFHKMVSKIAKLHVLVIDDWGLSPFNFSERRDILELMEDRYGSGSTVITSQYPVAKWHDLIDEATMADAILDRIIHNSHKIELKGESIRKKSSEKNSKKLTHSDH